MSEPFYITTPIYYVNSHPHIGHAYTTILADTMRRFRQMLGEETYFLTGTDEHGQKIAESAQKLGKSPQQFADEMSQEFRDLWPELHIQNDHFIRTTDPDHKKRVQRVLQKIYDNGEIYIREYEGFYCVGCERFMDEDELVEGNCPTHEKPCDFRKETNYFFKMSAYQDWLRETIEQNPDWIYPNRYRNELLQFLNQPLQDLCISRPKTRLNWGIDLPFDDQFVTYVWFDALLNYPNGIGWPDGDLYKKFWPHCHHVIAKDILKTHGIYWPCMLKAAGIPMFKRLMVHGYWIVGGTKMSKSLGNVVKPLDMKDRVGVDPLRYFLLRDMSFGEDSNFTEELLLTRYNGELANNIGNMINRSISMSRKNFNNKVPPKAEATELETELVQTLKAGIASIRDYIIHFQPHRAFEQVSQMSSAINKYIDTNAPWKLAKEEASKARLGTVLYHALDGARLVIQLLSPVMPEKMKMAYQALGFQEAVFNEQQLQPYLLPEGQDLPEPDPLFPKVKSISVPEEEPNKEAPKQEAKTAETTAEESNQISIEDFFRTELKVGKVVQCEAVKKSDKLLHSQIDVGEDRLRSIVSGIAKVYQPEDMVGRNVLVVANLKPAKLRGILSEGMLLCSGDGETLRLIEPHADAQPGEVVR